MSSHLFIGEVAQMLGITTKTLRHYEKLGLVTPTRSESGYRLYAPDQIHRLLRIRRLQALGLSLRQIKLMLKEQNNEQLFETILQSLLNEVEAQIETLEERRDQLEHLLVNGVSSLFIPPVELPFQQVQDYLDQHMPEASLWQQEKQIYALLDSWTLPSALTYLARYYPESVPVSVPMQTETIPVGWSGLPATLHRSRN